MSLTISGFFSTPASAAEKSETKALPTNNLQVPFFFDSRQTSFTRDGKKQSFDGDVVAIGNGVLIGADHIAMDQERGVIEASGHIVLLGQNQVLTGEALTYQIKTTDFVMHDAILTLNSPERVEAAQRRVLGFSQEELASESDRKQKIDENEAKKRRMREQYRDLRRKGQEPPENFYDQYAVLIEQGEHIGNQENNILARMNEERRNSLKRRREFWEKSRAALGDKGRVDNLSYFRIKGASIERTDGNDYLSSAAVWTPCKCEEDEDPDWGFRSDHIEAQLGGYADLYHAVLEIKGIPVLYLPYMKIPIKDHRQSGLLLPTIGFDSRNHSGTIYSQAAFFDLGPDRDSTVTVDNFENRGTRVGTEYRYQQSRLTGWTIGVEGIRDRVWMRERALHDDLGDMYHLGLNAARIEDQNGIRGSVPASVPDGIGPFVSELKRPAYWVGNDMKDCVSQEFTAKQQADCEQKQFKNFEVPANAWRGKANWKGMSFIASRLSLVSHGSFVSDHRYNSELYVPTDTTSALFGTRYANTYSPAKARVHLDGREMYASVGSSFGDNVLTNQRFKGAQIPGFAVAQSRMVDLDPSHRFIVPVYGQVSGESKRIVDMFRTENVDNDEVDGLTYLGDGMWSRGALKTVAPIVSDRVIQVDHFSEFESRQIAHSGLARKNSSIRSWRTGVRFQLPIDGKMVAPDSWQPEPEESGVARTRYFQHAMNWSVTVATRPAVVRRGPYNEKGDNGSDGVAYFVGDQKENFDADDGTTPEKAMAENQRISFSTSHVWRTFDRGWQLIPGFDKGPAQTDAAKEEKIEETSIERARRELLYSLDRPVQDEKDLLQGDKFLIHRYELQDSNSHDVVGARAGIGYDFLQAKRRREVLRDRAEATEHGAAPETLNDLGNPDSEDLRPWDPVEAGLDINAFSLTLANSMTYNIYDHIPTRLDFSLGLPTVLKTSSSVGYEISTEVVRDSTKEQTVYNRTKTRRASFVTNLIPKIFGVIDLRSRTRDITDGVQEYYTNFKAIYSPSSSCWQVAFQRTKEFTDDEYGASYVLTLNVLFLGQARDLPPLTPQLTRELRPDEES